VRQGGHVHPQANLPLDGVRLASELFFDEFPERIVFHGEVGIHALELGVLCLEFLDALEFGHAHAAVFALPVIEGRLGNAVLAADVGDLQSGVGFLEDRDDLGLGEFALLHGSVSAVPVRIFSFLNVQGEGSLQVQQD
jgi:hypothetical protein